ncbi:hypothetical protein CPB84DRAFT_526695 [Gymnopilus junonius]|uniref:Uncharacterized protein n=1 Tax=Gymnopilus junonius TaxID=109634 RepID=A0A9P5TVF6_GYMJU|nr:hypothetical protein CPB84DRAFT_526695 [Gymnopilus junonius]
MRWQCFFLFRRPSPLKVEPRDSNTTYFRKRSYTASRLNQNAERLKPQGNEFHQKGQYKAAYRKYTEAIKEDPKNAIYYANRAASSLIMKEFMDAAHDARKATEVVPTYAKAWGRLGTAEFVSTPYQCKTIPQYPRTVSHAVAKEHPCLDKGSRLPSYYRGPG